MKQQNLHKLAAMRTQTTGTVAAALLLIGSLLVVQADDKKEAKDPLAEKYAKKEKEIGAALKSGLISKEIAEKILKEYEKRLKADQRRGQLRNRQAGGAFQDARARADKAREDARARMDERRKNRGQTGGAPLVARARAGGDGAFQNSTSISVDGKGGRYMLTVKDGEKRFKAEGGGAVLFDGPVDTDEQRKKLNADLLKKLEQLEGQRVGNRAAAFRGRWEEMRKNRGQAGDLFARQRLGGFNRRNPFKDLDLTDEQQNEIAAIKLKQMEEQLEYSEMMKELEEDYLKRMEGILTDEQRKKYREMQSLRNRR